MKSIVTKVSETTPFIYLFVDELQARELTAAILYVVGMTQSGIELVTSGTLSKRSVTELSRRLGACEKYLPAFSANAPASYQCGPSSIPA